MPLYDDFVREIRIKNRASRTIYTLEQVLKKAEESLDKPLEDATFDELMTYIEGQKKIFSKNTVSLSIHKFVQFYKFCFETTEDIKYERLIKKLKKINTRIERSHINPSDILLPEDIKKLINVSTLERDRCIVSTFFESGMRIGEFLALTNNMVIMDEKTQEVTFNIPNIEGCKTGGRTVVCLEIFGYVTDWMKCNTSDMFMPVSKAGIKVILKRLFKKAGIKKPSNPHAFRHSAITHSVNLGMNQSSISMRFWGIVNSNMMSTYIHLSEQMQATSYRNAKGMGEESKIINPLSSRCISCGKLIQSGNLCVQCDENAKLKLKVLQQENKMEAMTKNMEYITSLIEGIDHKKPKTLIK